MNLAAILALLISSGVCAKSDFHSPNGATLRVVVCPVMAPADPPAEDAPPPARPAEPKKDERQAMG
jgi:hypothetical protein